MERKVKHSAESGNNELINGFTDEQLTERFSEAIKEEDERKIIKGAPVAKYDIETGRAYLLYPDGKKVYA
jgi:hypothetical protein